MKLESSQIARIHQILEILKYTEHQDVCGTPEHSSCSCGLLKAISGLKKFLEKLNAK